MKYAAFTLIELLVVISIIVLLLGILFPLLQQSREAAQSVVCRSNIKQLAFGLTMYESVNESFPYGFYQTTSANPAKFYGNFAYDKLGLWWLNYTTNYTKKNTNDDSIIKVENLSDEDIQSFIKENF